MGVVVVGIGGVRVCVVVVVVIAEPRGGVVRAAVITLVQVVVVVLVAVVHRRVLRRLGGARGTRSAQLCPREEEPDPERDTRDRGEETGAAGRGHGGRHLERIAEFRCYVGRRGQAC